MMNKLFHNLICGLRYKETLHYDLFNQNIFIDWQNPVYNLLVNYDKSNIEYFERLEYRSLLPMPPMIPPEPGLVGVPGLPVPRI